jgi:alkanesulfonate monooxygenase SsuD/methylene tetrahydromethanopterin reductase-like flavin-dependent oxidoreductase (luciferase family)
MVKERCDGTPQLNLRVPLEHHERVHKVVALLQSTKAFAARLDELIATASEPPSFLSEVIDRIERLEAALERSPIRLDSLNVGRGCGTRLGCRA